MSSTGAGNSVRLAQSRHTLKMNSRSSEGRPDGSMAKQRLTAAAADLRHSEQHEARYRPSRFTTKASAVSVGRWHAMQSRPECCN
jgi:hypothetical protein